MARELVADARKPCDFRMFRQYLVDQGGAASPCSNQKYWLIEIHEFGRTDSVARLVYPVCCLDAGATSR